MITAPLIAARKRKRQVLEHMASKAELRRQYGLTLRRREQGGNSITYLLPHRLPRFILLRMPLPRKAAYLYESRFDDHARDTKRATIELQRFVQRVPRAKAEHLTATELLCIAFVRRVFEQLGLFALPADLFDFATLASFAPESNGPRGGIKPHDVLQGVSLVVSSWGAASVPAVSLFERFRRVSFFEVICTNPQQFVQKGAGHRSLPRGARQSAPSQSNGVRAARSHHGVQR